MAMPMLQFDPECLTVVETYSGHPHEDPQAWLSHLQAVAELYQWDEPLCIKIGVLQLRGAAQLWAHRHQFATWFDFCQQLNQRFGETTESAAARLQQCFQQHGESPHAFADRFLCCAVKAGRCEDPPLLYSFTQRLLPELRDEALRQRLHSIADVVVFCDYWLTTQAGFEACQQYNGCNSARQTCILPVDFASAACEEQHSMHLMQECSSAYDPTYQLLSMCDSLERQLLLMQEQELHYATYIEQQLHARDLEIRSLLAALAERNLQQHKQQEPSLLHVFDASCDNLDACGDDECLELLACTDVAVASAVGLPAANPTAQQPTPCHSDPCEHPAPTFCGAPDTVSASALVIPFYISGVDPSTAVPPPRCDSNSLAPETPLPPSRRAPNSLHQDPPTQDETGPFDDPLGCLQHSPYDEESYKPSDLDYNMLMLHGLPEMTLPLLQVSSALSPASIQDAGGTTGRPQLPPWPHQPGNTDDSPVLNRHLQHTLAWSKLPSLATLMTPLC